MRIFIIILIIIVYILFSVNGFNELLLKHEVLKLLEPYSIPFKVIYKPMEPKELQKLKYPVVFKPSECSGKSFSVSIIYNVVEAKDYFREKVYFPLIIQEYHGGREVTIEYMKDPLFKKTSIIVVERVNTVNKVNKENNNRWDPYGKTSVKVHRPEWETAALKKKVEEISKRLKHTNLCRYDIKFTDLTKFLKGEDINIMEVNFLLAGDERHSKHKTFIENFKIILRMIFIRITIGATKLFTLQTLSLHSLGILIAKNILRVKSCGTKPYKFLIGIKK